MSKQILIVEDDVVNMKMMTDLLQAQGYDTLQSVDGKDFLRLTREYSPDLIIMDIQLPEISGVDHIKSLKADEQLMNIPVLAVTAFAKKLDEEKIRAAGCDGYITKPLDIPQFLDSVARFFS